MPPWRDGLACRGRATRGSLPLWGRVGEGVLSRVDVSDGPLPALGADLPTRGEVLWHVALRPSPYFFVMFQSTTRPVFGTMPSIRSAR